MNRIICKTVRWLEGVISRIAPLSWLYMSPYRPIVQREVELANIRSGEHVLQIGAGSIPYTAVYIAEMADVYVTAIDRDRLAVERGRRWIERMGASDRVQVMHDDGMNCPLSNIAAVFIALQVEPKEKVMDYIMVKGAPGLKVVVREPSVRYSSQYDPIPDKWEPISQAYQGMPTFTYSNLYMKV